VIKIKDSRGVHSHTLGFAIIAFAVGTFGYLYQLFIGQPYTLLDYGTFVATAILPFVIREYTNKVKE
jgi:hypothetical protein